MSCSNGCLQKCCALFPLGAPLDRLKRPPRKGEKAVTDGAYIADMLIPLTIVEATERAIKFDVRMPTRLQPLYTCRHWDESSGLCGAYDTRPWMCRYYPYGNACDHAGCGHTGEAWQPLVWEGDYN